MPRGDDAARLGDQVISRRGLLAAGAAGAGGLVAASLGLVSATSAAASIRSSLAKSAVPTYSGTLLPPALASMYPVDVTNDATYYYVLDAGRYRVVAVDRATGDIAYQSGGIQGSGPGQIGDARAIAIDSSSNVYVADTPNNRVEVFTPTLKYSFQFGSRGTGPGQFTDDYGIAVGIGLDAGGASAEVIYVVDGAGRIEKFDLSGHYISEFGVGLLDEPRQIAVHPTNHNVYVVNARAHQVVVFSDGGTKLFTFGAGGTGPGEFTDDPRGIAISADGSTAFVTDSGGGRVEAFNALTGAYLYQVGAKGTAPDQFAAPRGLTATADGHLAVSDEWGFGLHEFLVSGTFVKEFFGDPPPELGVNAPRGIHLDSTGRIWVDDYWNQRIDGIKANGKDPIEFGVRGTRLQPGSINFAWDVAVQLSTNRLFVVNRENNEIEVFENDGTFVTRWGALGSNSGQFTFPQGADFAPDGTLYVADSGNGRIQRFRIHANGTATFIAAYGQQGGSSQGAGYLNQPTGVSISSDGTLWVADTLNNSIQCLTAAGAWTRYLRPSGGTPFLIPWGVTVAPDGSIWVSDTGNSRLVKMTSSGVQVFAATGPSMGAGPVIYPFTVAFGSGTTVYMSDVWNNRVITLN
jgi:tripartite motif-containing protein 71